MDNSNQNAVPAPEAESETAPPLEVLVGGRVTRPERPAAAIVDTSKVSMWTETQNSIAALESEFDTKTLLLFIAEGFSLTAAEVTELYHHLSLIGRQDRLTVILSGYGGSPIAAYRAVRLMRRFSSHLTIVVPREAYSALTMLALGADEIVVGPLGVFSPTDTSIANHPLAPQDASGNPVTVEISQLKKYLELVEADRYSAAEDFRMSPHQTLSDKVHPIFLGTVQRSLSLSKQLMTDILRLHFKDEAKMSQIVDRLNDVYPSHAYPIMAEDMRELGLNVREMSAEQNRLSWDLTELATGFTKSSSDMKEQDRRTMRRATMLESMELRSFFSMEKTERMNNNAWTTVSTISDYRRAAVVKTKRGYYEARTLAPKEFRKHMVGEEVEVE